MVNRKNNSRLSHDSCEDYIQGLAEASRESVRRSSACGGVASDREASPPLCNTGGKSPLSHSDRGQEKESENLETELGLDYFRGTFPIDRLDNVLEFLSFYYGSFYLGKGGTVGGYSRKFEFATGVKVGFDTDPEKLVNQKYTALVEMPGQAWHMISGDEHRDLFIGLCNQEIDATRIDAKARDWKKVLDLEFIEKISLKRHFKPDRKFNCRISQGFRDDAIARTLYYGARGTKSRSGLFIRIYDKFQESKGAIDSIDFEVELTDKKCKSLQSQLWRTNSLSEWYELLSGVIASSIDFVDRDANAKIERCPRYPFWEKFIEKLGRATLSVRRDNKSLFQKMDYISNFHAKSIAMIREYFIAATKSPDGFDHWFRQLCEQGKEKMERKDWAVIAQALTVEGMPAERIEETLSDRLYESKHMPVISKLQHCEVPF